MTRTSVQHLVSQYRRHPVGHRDDPRYDEAFVNSLLRYLVDFSPLSRDVSLECDSHYCETALSPAVCCDHRGFVLGAAISPKARQVAQLLFTFAIRGHSTSAQRLEIVSGGGLAKEDGDYRTVISSGCVEMPLMLGSAPIRRSFKYLNAGKLVFKERVQVRRGAGPAIKSCPVEAYCSTS